MMHQTRWLLSVWLLVGLGGVAAAQDRGPAPVEAKAAPTATKAAPSAAATKAEPQPAGAAAPAHGWSKQDRHRLLALLVVLLPLPLSFLMGGVLVGLTALFPGVTGRAAEGFQARPWLALGWGAFIFLFVFGLVSFLGKVGGLGQLLAVLLVLALAAGVLLGLAALAETMGERVWALGERQPSRLAAVSVGTVVLTALLITPPGWFALFVVVPLALGAFRLAWQRAAV